MNFEDELKELLPCNCGDPYLSRGLNAPDCPFHEYYDEIIRIHNECEEQNKIEMKDLFGNEIQVVINKVNRVNPMVIAYGDGPKDNRCKHCKFLFHGKHYWKCKFRGNTNGAGTDHRANWPTCSKFKKGI